jgi:DNA helicase HerA-like ATPase
MSNKEKFISEIQAGYTFKGESILMGLGKIEDEIQNDAKVYAPLKMFNRHGLIAGATGTGKTITLQSVTESLSKAGVPCLIMDVKGDLSGIAMAGSSNSRVEERNALMGLDNSYDANPAEMLSISNEKGVPMRATVSEFGPVLFSKILGLNDTQEGVMSMIFKYCDDNNLPLLDLKDIKQILISANEELKPELTKLYGSFSPATLGTIQRKIIELEQQGAEKFFGEKSFEVNDLIRKIDGKGVVSCFRLADIQDKPKLFSTFMLCLLAEIYNNFEEIGDPDKPKLVIFIDEAHLIFEEATTALKKQLEATIKLIRSKGVGIFFITQNPADIPEAILGQLGMKIQHALRAFTAKDQESIKKAAENFPMSDYYKIDKTLISMGIGEALFTSLNEKGIPTPLVHTYMKPPLSRIGVLTPAELDALISNSEIKPKYSEVIDRESAYEILNKKIENATVEAGEAAATSSSAEKEEEGGGFFDAIGDAINSPVGKMITKEVTRGLLGVLGLKGTSTRRRTGLFG